MEKLDYLYAFDFAFFMLCGGSHLAASRWSQGKWCNAHMHFNLGVLSPREGALRFFTEIMRHRSNRRTLKQLNSKTKTRAATAL